MLLIVLQLPLNLQSLFLARLVLFLARLVLLLARLVSRPSSLGHLLLLLGLMQDRPLLVLTFMLFSVK
jgi:hypothetical protein